MRRWIRATLLVVACVGFAPSFAHAAANGEGTGDSIAHLGLLVALVLVAAQVGGELATRLKQPPVLGELLAGMVLGNLPWKPLGELGSDTFVALLSQLGVLILMFEVGLDATIRDVLAVGAAAARVAVLGTLGSLVAGFLAASLLLPRASVVSHLFLGAAISATSIGVTARAFKDLDRTKTPEARTILGAAVLDDVLGLLVLALIGGWLTQRASGVSGVQALPLIWRLVKTLGFLVAIVALGSRLTPWLFGLATKLRTRGTLLALALAFCLLLSWAANALGLAPLVGAFAAGLVLEDRHSARFVARGEKSLTELIEPLAQFLVPIFFVMMGIRADAGALLQPSTLGLALALTAASVVGKLVCGLGVARGVDRLTVAVGMIPRGEVALIFASLGMTLTFEGAHLLDARGYSAIVAVVILTTLLTPLLVRWQLARAASQADRAAIRN
ncbi:MAG TPA: cation:proton antiporter [Polyangiaceae bacterium]